MKLNSMLIRVLQNANQNLHSMNFALSGPTKKSKGKVVKQLMKEVNLSARGDKSHRQMTSSGHKRSVIHHSASKPSKKAATASTMGNSLGSLHYYDPSLSMMSLNRKQVKNS